MAHLPPEILPADAGFSKTVFMPFHGSQQAVMVTRRAGKFSQRTLKFASASAAMTWCAAHSANFFCFHPAPNPAKN